MEYMFGLLWLIIDCFLMLFSRIYLNISQYLKIKNEICINVHTLAWVQQ